MAEYDWRTVEPKWQRWWLEQGVYRFDHSDTVRLPYLVDNPPRYASGSLHLGHCVHYTHIDMAARYKRMRGLNVLFPLCFDTNGIPIEERVERKLGVTRLDVDRQEFIRLCREFAATNIDEMTRQFTILGCSMDPSEYYQTDAPTYRRITQLSFLEMLRRGLVYKGTFPVNWCPRCLTALADAEVEYKDRDSKFNDIAFRLEETGEEVIISTTRPELLCTCQAVAVHPTDKRVPHLVGKHMLTPLYDRRVPVIADEAVDPEKGTGIVMICSIGDKEDMRWILQLHLEFEMAIDDQGRMTERAGKYAGMPIEEARALIIMDLEAAGLLRGQKPTLQSTGTCWRCHRTIEFLRKPQWFLKSVQFKPQVMERADELNWYPEYMRVRLDAWVNSLEWDWVISRQRYFATPIPVWECAACGEVVPAKDEQCYVDPTVDAPPVDRCPKCGGGELRGCQDVFDTWMDSSVSPVYLAYWKRDDDRFRRYFPNGLRPQGQEIIRTWAYYSLLRSHLLFESRPWNDIMVDGNILAPDGTPMHASLGNAVDPFETLDTYGGDVMRYVSALCMVGQDNAFKPQDRVRGSRFLQKLWNVQQFIGSALERSPHYRAGYQYITSPVDHWVLARLGALVRTCDAAYDRFDFSTVIREVEQFVWHELADHYIELAKSRVYAQDDPGVYQTLREVGLATTKLLAPILPMLTEEVYQAFYQRGDGARSVHVSRCWDPPKADARLAEVGAFAKDVASAVRHWKSESGLALNAKLASVEVLTAMEGANAAARDLKAAIGAVELTFAASDETLREEPRALKPVHAKIGPEFRARAKAVVASIASADVAKAAGALRTGAWELEVAPGERVTLTPGHVTVESGWTSHGRAVSVLSVAGAVVVIGR
jgi:valyl-tRNA synthetase